MYDEQFPLDPAVLHLNHAAVGPWPRRTAEAVSAFARENLQQGSARYEQWLATEQALRAQLQRLLNADSSDEIALLKSTSEALSVVAHGLDWDDGDNVVITDQEFPSNRIVWESLRPLGVTVRQAPLNEGPSPEDAILERVGERTRLISVSSVQFGSGLRLDLERLGRYCRQHQILFCVDAIQSLGAVPMDVARIHADFVMADGHKWMLGPEGLAVFYCRAGVRERLTLHQYGWHMVEQMGEFERPDWQVARSGRRFECGSPNMLGIHALHASLQLLEEVGSEAIFTQVIRNTSYLIDKLNSISGKYEILTPTDPARHAGIVTFRPRKTDPEALFQHLRAGGVLCARRGGGIRFSPHFYTPPTVLDRALALL